MNRPLVVWSNTVPCDRCGGDVQVTTDGRRVAARTYGDGHGGHDIATVERVDTRLIMECGGPCGCNYRDCSDMCRGLVTVGLDTEHWTTHAVLIDRLMEEGVNIP